MASVVDLRCDGGDLTGKGGESARDDGVGRDEEEVSRVRVRRVRLAGRVSRGRIWIPNLRVHTLQQ